MSNWEKLGIITAAVTAVAGLIALFRSKKVSQSQSQEISGSGTQRQSQSMEE